MPRDETVRVYTGNAFDLIGERRRTGFTVDTARRWAEESFELKVRDRKTEPAGIRVVEHLYRWVNWELTAKSGPFQKLNAQEIEFHAPLKPEEEKTFTYTVPYVGSGRRKRIQDFSPDPSHDPFFAATKVN